MESFNFLWHSDESHFLRAQLFTDLSVLKWLVLVLCCLGHVRWIHGSFAFSALTHFPAISAFSSCLSGSNLRETSAVLLFPSSFPCSASWNGICNLLQSHKFIPVLASSSNISLSWLAEFIVEHLLLWTTILRLIFFFFSFLALGLFLCLFGRQKKTFLTSPDVSFLEPGDFITET